MRDQPTPEQTPERIAEIQRTLRPFINHRADCTFGQSNPDGDYCSCGVRGAITKANTLAAELVAQVDALTATLAHLTQENERLADRLGTAQGTIELLKGSREQAEATLARVKAQTEWQPIETAPKDGTNIILGWPKMVLGGYWADWRGPKGWVTPRGVYAGEHSPTHWMPLPVSPQWDAALVDPPVSSSTTEKT